MWHTSLTLTALEAVFRSLKSELGLRPVYFYQEEREDGHLFITVLAYQFVQIIRKQLQAHGIHSRWSPLRDILSVQRRISQPPSGAPTAAACLCAKPLGQKPNWRKSTKP